MRLERFSITGNYHILHDLKVDLSRAVGSDPSRRYALDFVVGVNGSGKSTFLRALTLAFLDLQAGQSSPFGFDLAYVYSPRQGTAQPETHVSIKSTCESANPITMTLTSQGASRTVQGTERSHLPKVVVFSSGSEAEWEGLLQPRSSDADSRRSVGMIDDPNERALREIPGHEAPSGESVASSEPGFTFIRSSRRASVTLCGLLHHLRTGSSALRSVLGAIGVKRVVGFSLELRIFSELSPREPFEQLCRHASRHVQQGSRHLLWFDLPNGDGGAGVANELFETVGGGSAFEFYRHLDKLQMSDATGAPTLNGVNIFFEVGTGSSETDDGDDAVSGILLFDWMSDGEQSFLGGMALLSMLDGDDMLILLDEPEVHFNDYWKREIVETLDQVLRGHSNHVLITSHSSITISDVRREDVLVFERERVGDSPVHPSVGNPHTETFGADPSDIMVHVFGARHASGQYSANQISHALETAKSRRDLEALRDHTAPGYWRYRIQLEIERMPMARS